jgi:hypothetical protein
VSTRVTRALRFFAIWKRNYTEKTPTRDLNRRTRRGAP